MRIKQSPNEPMPEEKIPRRLFLKRSVMAASASAVMLTTDAKAQDGGLKSPAVGGGDPGHPYQYMEEP